MKTALETDRRPQDAALRVEPRIPVHRIPRWLKWTYTAFAAAIVPVYARQYGWRNFLWFSDVALFSTVPALWLESRLIISMQAVSITVPELGWSIDFVAQALGRKRLIGLADYMFNRRIPRAVRAVSLFHVWLPAMLIWALHRLGYDRRAFRRQMLVTWMLLATTYAVTDPEEDINWVYGLSGSPQHRLDPRVYLLLVMAVYPIAFHWPAHAVFTYMFSNSYVAALDRASGTSAR
jgi:hypothetical protein